MLGTVASHRKSSASWSSFDTSMARMRTLLMLAVATGCRHGYQKDMPAFANRLSDNEICAANRALVPGAVRPLGTAKLITPKKSPPHGSVWRDKGEENAALGKRRCNHRERT